MTIEEVATKAGVTKSFISRFERDEVQASVATIMKIFAVLDIKPSEVFDPPSTHYVPAGTGSRINLGGHHVTERIISGQHVKSLMALHSIIEPGGGSGTELYVLNAECDLIYILEGNLDVIVGSEVHHLKPGDTLSFTPTLPHSWTNPSKTDVCKAIWVIAPPPS